jgi:hypothetical protein
VTARGHTRSRSKLRGVVAEDGEKGQQIGRALLGGGVDACHVQRVIGVRHDVSKPCRAHEMIGQHSRDGASLVQSAKRIGVFGNQVFKPASLSSTKVSLPNSPISRPVTETSSDPDYR